METIFIRHIIIIVLSSTLIFQKLFKFLPKEQRKAGADLTNSMHLRLNLL